MVNGADVNWPFVDRVPFISIPALGAFAFGLFCVRLFVHLWLWGRVDRRTPAHHRSDGREP